MECPSCSHLNRDGAVFCQKCGARQTGEAPPQMSIHEFAVAVQISIPDLRSWAGPDGDIALLATDMAGYGNLVEAVGPLDAGATVDKHALVLREVIDEFDAFELRHELDAYLLAVPIALDALECAFGISAAFESHNLRRPELRIPWRIGLHSCEAVTDDSAWYEAQIGVAVTALGVANVGSIVASSTFRDLTVDQDIAKFGEPLDRPVDLPDSEIDLLPVAPTTPC